MSNLVDAQVIDTGPIKSTRHGPFYPRASGLYKDCMRQLFLCTKLKVPVVSWIGFSLKVVFEIGNAVHSHLQNTDTILGNNRYGFWKCEACEKVSEFSTVPEKCHWCGAPAGAMTYKEYEINMTEPYYMTGHPDMFRKGEGDYLHVMEIKTIDGVLFDNLSAANIDHVWQLQAYMYACSRAKLGDGIKISPNVGHIMYVSKSKKAKTLPTKVFLIHNDNYVLNTIKHKLNEYKVAMKTGIPPKVNNLCLNSNFDNYLARSCPIKAKCMSDNEGNKHE